MSKITKALSSELTPQSVYKMMPPALRDKADEAKASLSKLNSGGTKLMYKLGHQINDVLVAQEDKNTELYGERPADSLAIYLGDGMTSGRLYQIRNFSKAFPAEFVNAQNDDPKNKMTLKHWIQISQYPDPKERERLVAKVQKTGMSTTELALLGRGDSNKTNNRASTGAKQKIPSNPIAAVNKLTSLLLATKNYEDQAYDFLLEGFSDVPPAELNLERTIQAYDKAIDQMDETSASMEKMRNGLSRAKADLEKRTRNKKSDKAVFSEDEGETDLVEDDAPAKPKKAKKKKKKKTTTPF